LSVSTTPLAGVYDIITSLLQMKIHMSISSTLP
jgi:hypothetical protein